MMTVEDVRRVLGARVLVGEQYLDREVRTACGADMMSDVLAFSKDHSILLTGLCNPQVIRTAEMLDRPDLLSWRRDTGCFLPAACFMKQACGEVQSDG